MRPVRATSNVWDMVPGTAATDAAGAPREDVGPGDRVGGDQRYELVERVGSGGMGAVFRAKDHKLGCDRAVKILDSKYASIPAFVERFRREAMSASRISHPNIVSVVDVAEEGERPVFLVMELLEGKTISQLTRGQGRLPWSQVQRYVDQIAAGLGAAHAQGVVHRDVKPGNCLVLADEQVKVLDFGIAKVTDMPAEVVALTAAGEIIGTCSYMAPEQIRGQVDKRSDIYALGVLTFRMLTGRVPFAHADQDKVLLAHLTEPPPKPSSRVSVISDEVDALVLRMLAKQPHQRFSSMEELREALGAIEVGEKVGVDGSTEPPGEGPGPGRATLFEEAPTRALLREGSDLVPLARPTMNTAPAGSGALTEFDGPGGGAGGGAGSVGAGGGAGSAGSVKPVDPMEPRTPAGTPASVGSGPSGTVALDGVGVESGAPTPAAGPAGSTVVLEDAPAVPAAPVDPVARGGTVVADGPLVAAVPPSGLSRPVVTAPAAAPRKLMGMEADASAPARVTRFAASGDESERSMLRGVLAAVGGVGLAIAVVAGWGWLAKRDRGGEPEPTPIPAAAVQAVEDASEDEAEAGAGAAIVPDVGGGEGSSTTGGAWGSETGSEPEPDGASASGSAGAGDASATPTEPKAPRKWGRRGKPKDTGSETDPPEPPPETAPPSTNDGGSTTTPRKAGDLRDPF